MHYKTVLFVEGVPETREQLDLLIAARMAPFDEALDVPQWKKRQGKEEMDRMIAYYGTSDLAVLATKLGDWDGAVVGGVDEIGLFGWSTSNPAGKWDYWLLGGYDEDKGDENWRDNVISTPEQFICHVPFNFVTLDGAWVSKWTEIHRAEGAHEPVEVFGPDMGTVATLPRVPLQERHEDRFWSYWRAHPQATAVVLDIHS